MNWKLVAALIVGSSLLAACGASNQAPATQSDTRTNKVETPGGAGEGATTTSPGAAPAAAPTTQEAKKPIVIHD